MSITPEDLQSKQFNLKPAFQMATIGDLQIINNDAVNTVNSITTDVASLQSQINAVIGGEATLTTGIVAHAGGGQALATLLTTDVNIVSTVASSGNSVKFAAGSVTTSTNRVIVNRGANSLNAFPAVGGSIDSLGVNAAFAVPSNTVMIFRSSSATQWYSETLPSTGGGVTDIVGDITFQEEIDHVIQINPSVTADTNGAMLTIKAGDGNGIADGGDMIVQGGKGGDDGTAAGSIFIRGGEQGLNTGATGSVVVETLDDTTGSNSGGILIRTGTSSGIVGPITTAPGGIQVRQDTTTFSKTLKQEISGAVTTSSGPGAIPVTGRIIRIATTGIGDAFTLANGTIGQWLTIFYLSETAGANTAILTPTTLAGTDSTITFANIGDSVALYYDGTIGWVIVGSKGVVIA